MSPAVPRVPRAFAGLLLFAIVFAPAPTYHNGEAETRPVSGPTRAAQLLSPTFDEALLKEVPRAAFRGVRQRREAQRPRPELSAALLIRLAPILMFAFLLPPVPRVVSSSPQGSTARPRAPPVAA